MLRFRKFLVIVLPVIVMFAWAGCIAVCAEDTAGHDEAGVSNQSLSDDCAAIVSQCLKICRLATPVAFQDRQNVPAPATEYGPVAFYGLSLSSLPQRQATGVTRILHRGKAIPLLLRPGNLRI